MNLVLASTSPYRKTLLEKLGLDFACAAPDVDETRHAGETPQALVARLAHAKAEAVAKQYPGALIIGSDQVAVCGNTVLGKPGDHARAVAQLKMLSGQRVTFETGLCLLNSATGHAETEADTFHVVFRDLDDAMIERYLHRERPYNCAGSFKSEGLGIALFDRLQGDDPNSLIGLPLIRLTRMLEKAGVQVL